MKCPLCTPGRYPDWPVLRQAGMQDWLRCPVCKTLFYRDGRKINEEDYLSEQKTTEKYVKGKSKSLEIPTLKKR